MDNIWRKFMACLLEDGRVKSWLSFQSDGNDTRRKIRRKRKIWRSPTLYRRYVSVNRTIIMNWPYKEKYWKGETYSSHIVYLCESVEMVKTLQTWFHNNEWQPSRFVLKETGFICQLTPLGIFVCISHLWHAANEISARLSASISIQFMLTKFVWNLIFGEL